MLSLTHGMVHAAPKWDQARGDLIDRWDLERQASPDRSHIILTHTKDEVHALNEAARERMRVAGDLGDDMRLVVDRGERSFAGGDRIMFLQNERGLGVKNGTLGTIEQVNAKPAGWGDIRRPRLRRRKAAKAIIIELYQRLTGRRERR